MGWIRFISGVMKEFIYVKGWWDGKRTQGVTRVEVHLCQGVVGDDICKARGDGRRSIISRGGGMD